MDTPTPTTGTTGASTDPSQIVNKIDPALILSGNATFTVQNTATGNRFTYKIKAKKADETKPDSKIVYFVSVLTGADNDNAYTFIGTIFDSQTFKYSFKSKLASTAQSVKAFDWVWRRRDSLPAVVALYHAGKCLKCGRTLTTPDSIKLGLGPECAASMGAALAEAQPSLLPPAI